MRLEVELSRVIGSLVDFKVHRGGAGVCGPARGSETSTDLVGKTVPMAHTIRGVVFPNSDIQF